MESSCNTKSPRNSSSSSNCSSNVHLSASPTTFVQADTSSFKQVVQMLTGSSKPHHSSSSIPPVKTVPTKLQQRRNSLLNTLSISSSLDFPSLLLSPVTPLDLDTQAHDNDMNEKPRDAQPRLLPLFPTTSPSAPPSYPKTM